LYDGVEDGLQIGRGTADNVQDLAGCGLLLTRLVALARSLVELLLQVGGGCASSWRLARLSPRHLMTSAFARCIAPSHVASGRSTTVRYPA
jgi:hypothetical protein